MFKTKNLEPYSTTTQTQEYNIASGVTIRKLIEDVNDCLKQGWCCKGPMIVQHRGEDIYHQTLVRKIRYPVQSTGPK